MTEQSTSRAEEIQQIRRDYPGMYRIAGGILLIISGVIIGPELLRALIGTAEGYGTNIYTELLSVIGTILVLDFLQERREERREIIAHQERLVRDVSSPIHATAISALNNIRRLKWLGKIITSPVTGEIVWKDNESILSEADLSFADLHEADLFHANLSKTSLYMVNLKNAVLQEANLKETYLVRSDLSNAVLDDANLTKAFLGEACLNGASLTGCDLTGVSCLETQFEHAIMDSVKMVGADLSFSNLRNGFLFRADLRGSDLSSSELSGANLLDADLSDAIIQKNTIFDKDTTLPNGEMWSSECDFALFGAEVREIEGVYDEYSDEGISNQVYAFKDGTKRRWQLGKGWLDDRDGNPIA